MAVSASVIVVGVRPLGNILNSPGKSVYGITMVLPCFSHFIFQFFPPGEETPFEMSNIVSFVESISLHLGSGGTCGKTVGDRACLEDGEGFLIWHLVLKVRVLVFNDDLFFLAFRNCVGQSCAEELNQLVLRSSMGAGFTGIEICAADTTVQESPIAYPTEVGHLKNIAENILGFGKKLRLGSMETLVNLKDMAQGLFTSIRLFT